MERSPSYLSYVGGCFFAFSLASGLSLPSDISSWLDRMASSSFKLSIRSSYSWLSSTVASKISLLKMTLSLSLPSFFFCEIGMLLVMMLCSRYSSTSYFTLASFPTSIFSFTFFCSLWRFLWSLSWCGERKEGSRPYNSSLTLFLLLYLISCWLLTLSGS